MAGGDSIHRDPKYIEPCFEQLKGLKAPMGKFGVFRNHDHWESKEITLKNTEMAGIIALDNRAIWVNNRFGFKRTYPWRQGDVFRPVCAYYSVKVWTKI